MNDNLALPGFNFKCCPNKGQTDSLVMCKGTSASAIHSGSDHLRKMLIPGIKSVLALRFAACLFTVRPLRSFDCRVQL